MGAGGNVVGSGATALGDWGKSDNGGGVVGTAVCCTSSGIPWFGAGGVTLFNGNVTEGVGTSVGGSCRLMSNFGSDDIGRTGAGGLLL